MDTQFNRESLRVMPTNVVTQLAVKSHNSPDEKRRPDKTEVDVVNLGDYTVGRFTFQPGWRWSDCIKPVVHTESCQVNHIGYCVSGALAVETTDGNRINISAGDSYTIPPGHDAWVDGEQSFVGIEFVSAAEFAKPPGDSV
jgi:quercetin dioxygenase-like cupin family protein